MVGQKIKEISIRKLLRAKKVLAVFEILGISEDDLKQIKEIPALKEELAKLRKENVELREFKDKAMKTLEKTGDKSVKSQSEVVKDVYTSKTKEFRPHYEQD